MNASRIHFATKASALVALAACAASGFFALFTTWAPYDDEGYVLVTLQHHAAGRRLYDDVFTQYGPAFYQLEAILRACVPHPFSGDAQRLKTLGAWLTTAAIGGFAVVRLTGRPAWGGAAAIVAFVHLDRLALEPGHPQIWCVSLVSLLSGWFAARSAHDGTTPAAAPLTTRAAPWSARLGGWLVGWWAPGAICGLLAMIKPNIGALALGGAVAGVVWTGLDRRRPLWRRIEILFSGALAAGPWALCAGVLDRPEAWLAPLVASVSLLLVRNQCLAVRPGAASAHRESVQAILQMVAAAAGVATLSAGLALAAGTSPAGLVQGLVGQHGALIARFYHSPPLPAVGWPVAIGLLAWSALGGAPGVRSRLAAWSATFDGAVAAIVACGLLATLADCGSPLVHGLAPRGAAGLLAGVGSLFAWRLLATDATPAKAALVAVAVLSPLTAFPTPGTQMAVGTLGLWIVLATRAAEWLDGASGAQNAAAGPASAGRRALWTFGGPIVVTAILVAAVAPAAERWFSREPLGLGGARLLRLDDRQTRQCRQVIGAIRQSGADSLAFTWHNRNSFYAWAGLPPPTPMSPTFWPYLLDESQQRRVAADLKRFATLAVVDEPYEPSIAPPASALQSHLRNDSRLWTESPPYSIRLLDAGKHVEESGRRVAE